MSERDTDRDRRRDKQERRRRDFTALRLLGLDWGAKLEPAAIVPKNNEKLEKHSFYKLFQSKMVKKAGKAQFL